MQQRLRPQLTLSPTGREASRDKGAYSLLDVTSGPICGVGPPSI